MIQKTSGQRRLATVSAATLAVAMGWGLATQAAAQAADPAADVEEVVVTGSRIVRDGFEAPTPVTVVSSEQLQAAAPSNIADGLNQLPLFRASSSNQTGGAAATSQNSGSFLNLRNLGATRTLLLLDGRRVVPSSNTGASDTNLLPQSLVQRVDVVTGGASAAYGSDAVAGVVNFVLDTGFEGFKGKVQGGLSDENDAGNYEVNLTYGRELFGGRGHIVLSLLHAYQDGIPSSEARDWGKTHYGLAPPGNGVLANQIVKFGYNAVSSPNGLITALQFPAGTPAATQAALNAQLQFLTFGPDGTPRLAQRGEIRGQTAIGGNPNDISAGYVNLLSDVTRSTAFAHFKYNLTDKVEGYAQLSLAEVENWYPTTRGGENTTNVATIFSGNPFIPAQIQALMTANNIPSFSLARTHDDILKQNAYTLNDTYDIVVGAKGEVINGWKFDAYWEHGENRARTRTVENKLVERMYAAYDAVRAPDGSIVCRVQLTNPGAYPGCVPFNPFGQNRASAGADAYVSGISYFKLTSQQDVASLSFSGDVFDTWAGTVSLAFGGEYRREELVVVSDDRSQSCLPGVGEQTTPEGVLRANNICGTITSTLPAGFPASFIRGYPAAFRTSRGQFQFTNVSPLTGKYDIKEFFAETIVPLAKDMPFAQSVEFQGAVRYADYSTSGGVVTWKAGLTWEPTDEWRVRVTQSRDIRAGNMLELFSGQTFTQSPISRDPITGFIGQVLSTSSGNPTISPEKALTFTGGVVYRPNWLPGFNASIDYYKIELADAIGVLSAQQTVDECQRGSQVACDQVIRDPNTRQILRILTPRLNLSSQDFRGVDMEFSYARPLSDILGDSVPGNIAARAVISRLLKAETTAPGATPRDTVGEVGVADSPRWSGTFQLSYDNGPFNLFVQERFIGAGVYRSDYVEVGNGPIPAGFTGATSMVDNNLPAIWYTDVTVSYKFGPEDRYQGFFTVNNLFDQDPVHAPSGGFSLWIPTNASLYDQVGRRFTAGVRFKY